MEGMPLLPLPQGLQITHIEKLETGLMIHVLSTQPTCLCPLCEALSDAVHSRYQRSLKDLPYCGQQICLQLTARKFFCQNPQCQRKIFTERLPTFVEPWAQMTLRLSQALQAIGLSTSGSLGARLSLRLGIATSWMTILRHILRLP
ncbi:MAG TPA: transposase family protein [Ktedonobacteraceae bacterium]|nr:transposase family protein [Ktedonobacteraceae bacterium]